MKLSRLAPFSTLLAFQAIGIAMATTYAPPPDSGIPDEYLLRVGRRTAIDLLLRRLEDEGYAEYHEGIVQRIDWFLELSPDSDAIRALDGFVRRGLAGDDRTGRVVETACRTLHKIGARGGLQGEKVLETYLSENSPLPRTRNPGFEGRTPRDTIERLSGCAIRGLGLSGTKSAERILRALQRNPPSFFGANKRKSDIEAALKDIARIQEVGIGAVYQTFFSNPFRPTGDR